MDYREAVATLEGALKFGIHPSLEGIARMTAAMGHPECTFASIQVTGTNGKTSVTRMTAALLHAHELRVGCYTSPHLLEYRERIEIDGVPLGEQAFADAVEAAADAAAREQVNATEFELLTAAALWAFRAAAVDFAVLEVGMGGRWDATSIVSPTVAVITGVALDHTERLGDTREAIAEDKAHIIRSDSVPVVGPGTVGVDQVFLARCALRGVKLRAVRAFGDPTPADENMTTRYRLLARPAVPDGCSCVQVRAVRGGYDAIRIQAPAYQAQNVATAIAAAEEALERSLTPAAVARAFTAVRVPGRFEVVARDPWVVVDGAHNPQAAAVLADAIEDAWPARDGAGRPTLLLAVLSDKDARGIAEALAPVVSAVVVSQTDSPRALPALELAQTVRAATGMEPIVTPDIAAALAGARAAGDAGVVATGSITTVAAVSHLLGLSL